MPIINIMLSRSGMAILQRKIKAAKLLANGTYKKIFTAIRIFKPCL